jgi:hypothetical protein
MKYSSSWYSSIMMAAIMMTAKQFEKTGSVINLQARKRNTSQKRKNAKIILEKVMSEKPSLSIRKANQIVKISCSLTRLVLKNDLGLKPYKKPDLHEIETNTTILYFFNSTILF